jgi:primosomal protein N' (replication factor Y)
MEEVQQAFPGVKALRWDRDAASARGAHETIMESFVRGEAQVLVGTQMIAKGLHFPNVTLVGVLCADIGLFLPDFRAGERVFQLLCQVAGRTGRGPLGGQVIVQTYSPHHYAVAAASAQDYKGFYQEETTYRREQGLPPFGRLIHLVYLHTNQGRCHQEALRLGGALKRQRDVWGLTEVDILGPAPAYPPRLRGRYRWHIVLRGQGPRSLLEKTPIPQGWTVDVDPLSVS